MISLKPHIFDSGLFSHLTQTGSNFVEYYFNHYQGRVPDQVTITFDRGDTAFTMAVSRDADGAFLGYDFYNVQTPDTLSVRMFNLFNNSGAGLVRLKAFWY